MIGEFSYEAIAWCSAALMLGGFVKGVIGIGLPMISIPLMSLMVPPYVAAAMLVLPIFPANVVQMRTGGPLATKIRRFWPLILGLAIGTFTGGWFFINADPRVLQLIVGTIVAVFTIQRVLKTTLNVSPTVEKPVGATVGLVGGAIAGMAMLVGPLVVVFMSSLRLDRETFVGSIAFIYFCSSMIIGAALASYSQLTTSLITASLLSCIPAMIGVTIGNLTREHISQTLFEKLLNLMLATIAISLFVRALT